MTLHAEDDRSEALRELARIAGPLVVLNHPGRLVITTNPVHGSPVVIVVLWQPSYPIFDPPTPAVTGARRVFLDVNVMGWYAERLYYYAHSKSDERAALALFDGGRS